MAAQVRLKVNMIIDGVNHPVGSLFEKSKIPSRLRSRENYEPAAAAREESEEEEVERSPAAAEHPEEL